MKRNNFILLFLVVVQALNARDARFDVAKFLPVDTIPYYAQAEVIITLPITQQDVRYNAKISALPSSGDKALCRSDYLIEAVDSMGNKSIYSYFDGNYFAYSCGKFREYHWVQDSLPFMDKEVKGRIVPGIHKSGMFPLLVPAVLKSQLKSLASVVANRVRCSPDSLVAGKRVAVLEIDEYIKGVPAREMKFVVDAGNRHPIYYQVITSPGTTGEQMMEMKFGEYTDSVTHIDEQMLVSQYSDIFSTYRTSNFSANSLVGKTLPMFTLPSLAGARYIWKGRFNAPALLVFLKCDEGVTRETIDAVRQAIDETPLVTETLWIFEDKNSDAVTDAMGDYTDDYTVLFNARRFAAQCGITGTPTIVIVDKKGKIHSVAIGYSRGLKQDLIQRLANL